MTDFEQGGFRAFLFSRSGMILLGFLGIAGYFLWTEHEAHVKELVPYLPYFLLLACPLLHLFMHHGPGGHGHGGRSHRNDRNHEDRPDGGPPTGSEKP